MGDPVKGEIVVAEPPRSMTPMEMLSRAVENGQSIDVLDKLMGLQERYDRNEARKAFDAAMADAKAELPIIKKNRHVGFESRREGGARTDYMHENMAEIARVVTPILSKHGLSYRFRTHYEPGQPVSVTCIISHRLGHFEENTLPGPPDTSGNKNSIQAIGSTVTYLQRYTLKAAIGLAAEQDDDGKASGADEPISEEQLKALWAKIDETKGDAAKLCETLKIDALPDLSKSRYGEAERLLNERAKLIAKRKGAQ